MGTAPRTSMHFPTLLALAALLGAPAAALLPRLLRRAGFCRSNYRGEAVAASGGLYFLAGPLILPGSITGSGDPAAAALCGFMLLGFLDDRMGTPEFKGIRGHLRALRAGRVTTGLLKAVGGLSLGALLGWWIEPGPFAALSALLIALSANLLNLLDLRPLRALKLFWLAGGLLALLAPPTPPLLAVCLGQSAPYAAAEARRRVMLGDSGANALGGLLGVCLVLALPLWARLLAVAILGAAHAAAERGSFSERIERSRWLSAVDRWGRAG